MIERIGLSARSARTKRPGHLQGACLIAASALLIVLTTAALAAAAVGQPPRPAANAAAPMPDVGNLLREVTARQKSIEQLREDYDYTEASETREFDGSGRLKETKTEEYQIFFVNGRHIRRLVKRDGKPLDASEEKKEQERVSKEINKASKDSLEDRQNKDAVSLSRIVENSNWSNARRLLYNGRSTLAYDFTSNPHARTQTRAEDVFKDLSGTVWIDEKDRTIVRLAAHFAQDFHVGAGLLASVHKGSTLTADQALINHEIWLPVKVQVHIDARIMLFKSVAEDILITTSNYHKFSVNSTQQPGVTVRPPA